MKNNLVCEGKNEHSCNKKGRKKPCPKYRCVAAILVGIRAGWGCGGGGKGGGHHAAFCQLPSLDAACDISLRADAISNSFDHIWTQKPRSVRSTYSVFHNLQHIFWETVESVLAERSTGLFAIYVNSHMLEYYMLDKLNAHQR